MRTLIGLMAAPLILTLAACVTTGAAPDLSGGPVSTMESACVAAVQQATNNTDVIVLGSDPIGGGRSLTLDVGRTGVWICDVTSAGAVTNVSLLGSDGSPLA